MRSFVKWNVVILAFVLFGALGATVATADSVGFTPNVIGSPPDYQAGIPVNLGMVFTANANFSVNALGFYYEPGLTGPETVGLYNSSGILLASVVVSDSGTPVDGYLWASLAAPLSLTKGQTYTVVAYTGDNPWAFGTVTSNPLVTFDYDDYCYSPGTGYSTCSGSGLEFPSTTGGSGPAYFGANFAIPEPSVVALLTLGLLG